MINDNNHPTLADLAVQNVATFLQTVVVVDDKARLESPSKNDEATKIEEAEEQSPVGVHADLVSPEADTGSTLADPEGLDAKSLVDGFANEGIACAVLRPISKEDVVSQATKLAELADIVVLDWILGEDNGAKAKSMILKVIGEGSGSDRMRLIAVYTGESDLPRRRDQRSRSAFQALRRASRSPFRLRSCERTCASGRIRQRTYPSAPRRRESLTTHIGII